MMWMSLEPAIQTEVSQKEKRMSHTNAYIWYLERWCWWTYLQGNHGGADIENRLMDRGGGQKVGGGMNGESNMEVYTLPCVK